ncbi:erythrocyte membrane protein 1 [Plasmodium falciparum IGH-CR14]|uniref:Erythrocyte membrane protein 1 n=1 Tax=Plasmodium falciparum IGH-CR14 TaxID=580059 RepID=A0A0L1I9T0_PLAFA|nr:erythrocyte membrane protein 1 [Plasmodium falciparum IGH-CR14]
MVPKPHGSAAKEPDYSSAKDAKELLDRIGEQIYKKAKDEALEHSKSDLQGILSKVHFKDEKIDTQNICNLDHTKHTNVSWGVVHPCDKRSPVRFSDESRSQCSTSRIIGNNSNTGACAPYRKLQLCDYNLERITDTNTTNTQNLLVDVLLAAKYEGESLMKNSSHLINHNKEGICTALARSFADIGDIIRGKDLYLGYNETDREKKRKLQQNLKEIFAKIYGKLKDAKKHYEGDDNYYQLREDWWNINRKKVWDAITCDALQNANYFRNACSEGTTSTQGKCQCIDQTVPTYFDYVPQFLRWFEEWVEEFCRIKELKLENVKTRCRGENNEKYCSRNGHNCEETIRAIGKLRLGNGCTRCLFACNPYVEWINKKEEQFDKQKKKCENEIYLNKQSTGTQDDKINNLYYQDFYNELRKKYKTINEFLKSLNKETKCKNLEDDRDNKLDFSDNTKTFSYSKYCDLCPWCAVKLDKDGNFVEKRNKQGKCEGETLYTPNSDVEPTVINVLNSGEEQNEIKQKLDAFCAESNSNRNFSLYEEWKCYYEKSDNEACILQTSSDTDVKNQKPFFDFLMFWVAHMLKDSIYWRTKKLDKCLKNGTTIKCKDGCKNPCKCFERWVKQKETEWTQIKTHFDKQNDFRDFDPYQTLETVLEQEFSTDLTNAYGDAKEIEQIKKFLNRKDTLHKEDKTYKNTIIDELIKHEKDDANKCTQTHTEDPCAKDPSSTEHHEHDSDEEDEDSEEEDEEEIRNNPCTGDTSGSSTTHPALAHHVAHKMHQNAKQQMKENTPNGAHKCLVGDISKAIFRNGGNGIGLDENICKIDKNIHTNDSRTKDYEGPCTGKDGGNERFNAGTKWEGDNFVSATHKNLYIPPRRQHMCTSNLEKLDFLSVTTNNEAQRTKEHFAGKKDDHGIACRSVRYSFADIGDIIRGRDLWEHNDFKDLETKLVTIFEKIKDEHKGTLGDKYTDDEKKKPKYKELREDWWEANRHQVWNAMKCATTSGKIQCNNHAPYDDYIPQRLRWMTEWAEWFCKMQSQEYNNLVNQCGKCMQKGQGGKECTKDDNDCTTCDKQCKEYKEKIKEWQNQWKQMDEKYQKLYLQAEVDAAANGGPHASSAIQKDKDKHAIEFLFELYKENGGKIGNPSDNIRARHRRSAPRDTTHVYKTAAGYIHQELQNMGCTEQTKFCMGGHNYAFKEPPKEYEKACDCVNNKPKPAHTRVMRPWPSRWKGHWEALKPLEMFKKRTKKKTTCEIVEEILKDKNEKSPIDGCYPKNIDKKYNDWNCDEPNFKSGQKGACMPPRRQKLCLYYLKQEIKNLEQLKNAFVKCAAAETFLLWQYYKSKNDNSVETQLKAGKIPPEFLRSMFYTIADYRDLCLGTDILLNKVTLTAVGIAKDNINSVFSMTGKRSINDRKKWWEKHGPEIWKGMLCALSYDTSQNNVNQETRKKLTEGNNNFEKVIFGSDSSTTLSKFSERPQFLRWFTEWGEDFCREHKTQLDKLMGSCKECTVSESGTSDKTKTCDDKKKCDACKTQCEKYKKWIETWKKHYTSQNEKFQLDKTSGTYEKDAASIEANSAKHARDYLKTQLENMICTNGNTYKNCDYTCMDTPSSTNSKMPKSLDDEPEVVKGKCNCVPNECNALSVNDSGFPDAGVFGGGIYNGKCKGFEEHIPKKIETPQYDPTNDILKSTIPVGIALALGSITFLFIKKKPKSPVDLLRVLNIPKGEYRMPTLKSKNRYIPYRSGTYKGKTYIYMEGDTSGDEKYAFMSDTTDVTSSESEYEELDINDIYVPGSPKYKTLIEVVLEPSGKLSGNTIPTSGKNTTASGKNTPSDTQNDIPSGDTPPPITDDEWNTLKDEFISQYLQSEQPKDVPNDYSSGDIPFNTQPNTLYFDNNQEKPFITSIHDRNLYSGEEYSYNVNMSTNSMDDIPLSDKNDVYSGIDLINDTLSGNQHIDIYDEVLKRKENELFGTNHVKQTSIHSVAKLTNSDPIHNQLELFHKWLDRNRDMCEKWENHHERLAKLKEKWENDTSTSGNTHPSGNTPPTSDIPSGKLSDIPSDNNIHSDIHPSDIPSGKQSDIPSDNNIHSDIPYVLNTDVSIQIHMDNPKTTNEFTYVDSNPDLTLRSNPNLMENNTYVNTPTNVQIEMDVNSKLVKEKYPIADVWDI